MTQPTPDKQLHVEHFVAQHPPRFMDAEDIDRIIEFEHDVFEDNPLGSPYYWDAELRDNPQGTELFVVEGIVAACLHSRLRPSRREPGRVYGEITSLGIREQFRGQGLGEFLLRRGMDRLLTADPTGIALQTSVHNAAMQGLAHKTGFHVHSVLNDYYRTPHGREDAYYMIYLPEKESKAQA